jgi:hypothetical protein
MTVMVLMVVTLTAQAQWEPEWTSTGTGTVTGWLAFQQSGDSWLYRYYSIDTVAFRVMSSSLSVTPQYSYVFTAAERLAGELVYSLGEDLTGDGIVEFYVLAAYGTSPYRETIKVFDITNGQTVCQRDLTGFSYSAATVWDVNSDGTLDCVFSRVDYPAEVAYSYEVYNTGVSASAAAPPRVPVKLNLGQNYPNPFNPSTRIEYSLSSPGRVQLDILNVLGQQVRTIVNEMQTSGSHTVQWDGTDGAGSAQASGAYYYQLRVNGQSVQARQMILLK